jgi:curli biogenesis system outer membrane secretion channel CsgG
MKIIGKLYCFTIFFLGLCGTLAAAPAARTIAVWSFDNNSMAASGELDFLRQSLADTLLAEFAKEPGLRLVEREQLQKVLEEQKLASSELVSEADRLKLGRIAGATHMAFGSFMEMGGQVRIDVRVVEVETSLVKASADATTSLGEAEQALQGLAQKLAANLTAP